MLPGAWQYLPRESRVLGGSEATLMPMSVASGARFDLGAIDSVLASKGASSAQLEQLVGLLRKSPSGLGFVYRALELLAEAHDLDDCAVTVAVSEFPSQQVFRLRRPGTERPSDGHLGDSYPAGEHPTAEGLTSDRRTGGRPRAERSTAEHPTAERSAGHGPAGGRGGSTPAEVEEWWRRIRAGGPGFYSLPDLADEALSELVCDLTALALRQDLLRHQAVRDPLTGLYNRRVYDREIELAVADHERYGWPFALVFIDLDDFKSVNDRLGHAAGDRALAALGKTLKGVLRAGDVAARIGGDEFALLVRNVDSDAGLDALIRRVAEALKDAVSGERLSFSVGSARYPVDAGDASELARVADLRLYSAKAARGG